MRKRTSKTVLKEMEQLAKNKHSSFGYDGVMEFDALEMELNMRLAEEQRKAGKK